MAKKRIKVPISSARSRLFELADFVRKGGDDTVVVFEQRGGLEGVALVRESRLEYLEARVKELEKKGKKPFRLRGSLKLVGSENELEEALRDIRKGWTRKTPLEFE